MTLDICRSWIGHVTLETSLSGPGIGCVDSVLLVPGKMAPKIDEPTERTKHGSREVPLMSPEVGFREWDMKVPLNMAICWLPIDEAGANTTPQVGLCCYKYMVALNGTDLTRHAKSASTDFTKQRSLLQNLLVCSGF